MIIFSNDDYTEQIKHLWKEAFSDTDESIDFYFSHVHKNENMLIDVENGKVRAMLTMHPVKLFLENKIVSARYIYAVATRADLRGQGISGRLLEYAHGYMREQNVAVSLLVPATKKLFDFYEKRRYKKAFLISERFYDGKDISKPDELYTYEECTSKEYYEIRKNAFLPDHSFAFWDEEMLFKVMEYARFFGAKFYKISTSGCTFAIYVIKNDDEAFVHELALKGMQDEDAMRIIHEIIGAKTYAVRTGANTNDYIKDYAMVCNLKDEDIELDNAYFNLAME